MTGHDSSMSKFIGGVKEGFKHIGGLALTILFFVLVLAFVFVPPTWIWEAVTTPAVSPSGKTIIDGKYFGILVLWTLLVVYPVGLGVIGARKDD